MVAFLLFGEITSPLSSLFAVSSSPDRTDVPRISPIPPEGLDLDVCLHDLEKTCYEEAIRRKDGNREAAARLLGIKPHTFRKRAKDKFGQ